MIAHSGRPIGYRRKPGIYLYMGHSHLGLAPDRRPPLASGGKERGPSSAATSSAIWAVFSAAPLRRLSPQTNKSIAHGSSSDWRTRPTQDGSVPTASTGVGNSPAAGLSATSTPGAARSTFHASSRPTGRENTACTATE